MERVKLGDVAIEKRETWTGSIQGVPIVGLEHLVPGEVTLSSWDSDSDNTFSKMFRKGQVLLGRRRVYLKKAVIAPFDGICSGDITVIEAIPGKISARLLPFVIQNERFFDYAMQGSAGSLSPRVKWEHLKDYEFNLPDYEEQDCLADKLWSALKLRESYQSLLQATDEMVKSRFISRFLGSSYSQKRLGEVANVFSGKTINLELENEGGPIAYLKVADLNLPENDRVVTTSSRFVTEETARTSGLVPIGATIFPKNGAAALHNKKRITSVTTCVDMNTMAVYSTSNTVIPEYLYAYLESQDLAALTLVGAIPQIRAKDVQSLVIPVPPIREQEQYVAVMHQADKSKFELKQAIEKIDKVMRALIQ